MTPPFFATSGNICPGLLKYSAFFEGSARSFIVLSLSPVDIPVVVPSAASTDTVKAVP